MNVTDSAKGEGSDVGRSDLIARVRYLDPECNVENVERFFREIDAATAVLLHIDASSYPVPFAFDPHWSQVPKR